MPHKIAIDAERRFIDVKVTGILEVRDVHDYVHELTGKYEAELGGGSLYVMLIDITECSLQSQDVVAAFRSHITNFPKATRLAVVNANSSARMQLQQILSRDYLRWFEFYRDAKAWLLEAPLLA